MYARGLRFVKLRPNWRQPRAKKVFTNRRPCARFVNKKCYLPSENLSAKLLVNPWRARLSGAGAENHPRDWRRSSHDLSGKRPYSASECASFFAGSRETAWRPWLSALFLRCARAWQTRNFCINIKVPSLFIHFFIHALLPAHKVGINCFSAPRLCPSDQVCERLGEWWPARACRRRPRE